MFYVLAGTMSVLVDTEWIEAGAGSFVLVPGIAQWFDEHPPGEACR